MRMAVGLKELGNMCYAAREAARATIQHREYVEKDTPRDLLPSARGHTIVIP